MNRARVIFAWLLLTVCLIGWPASALTLAKEEPQFVLGLSWCALIIEAANLITTSQLHQKADDDDDEDSEEE